ncbi:MAG: hypothetical protein PHH85_02010 [Candidatus Methanoperedens sp.]|nr:hypothetical protein [Candidatus Methanoperedens sp.]
MRKHLTSSEACSLLKKLDKELSDLLEDIKTYITEPEKARDNMFNWIYLQKRIAAMKKEYAKVRGH